MKHSCKGHKGRNRHKNRMETSGQAWLVYVKDIDNRDHVKVSRWGLKEVEAAAINDNDNNKGTDSKPTFLERC